MISGVRNVCRVGVGRTQFLYTHQFIGDVVFIPVLRVTNVQRWYGEVTCCFWDGGWMWPFWISLRSRAIQNCHARSGSRSLELLPPLSCDCDEGNELSYVKPKDHIYICVQCIYFYTFRFLLLLLTIPFYWNKVTTFFSHVKLSQQKLITDHSNRVLLPRF